MPIKVINEELLNAYIKLIEKHKDDKAALKEIDIAFDTPLAEANKTRGAEWE